MATGDLIHGAPALPLYGKNGTLLYKTPITMSCSIVISWSGGDDLDICAFFTHLSGQQMGYGHASSISDGGFTGSWPSGDNTSGGPETVNIGYSGNQGLSERSFEVHANWYETGEGKAGGPATVTATDGKGNVFTYTINPATSKHRAANTGDPGVRIYFNNNGTIREVGGA